VGQRPARRRAQQPLVQRHEVRRRPAHRHRRGQWLEIRDAGIGIAARDHARIFERFERGDAPSGTPGFGLGLWIARSLLRELGGTLSVDSEPGAGATFTVRLPRAA
jgi:signal transduction histidine kinase